MRRKACRLGWRRPEPLIRTRTLPIKSRIALAWASLWAERVWNGLWPAQAVVLALLALGISGLLPALGPLLHSLGLIAAAAWLGWTLWQRRSAWTLPTRDEAVRRLERDSGAEHRPLQGLADKPLDEGPAAQALWAAHQRQLAARLQTLQPRPPVSTLPRLDRYAWRAGAMLGLAVAVAIAGYGWRDRLAETLTPRFAAASPAPSPAVNVWAEPPPYTGRPPIFAPTPGEPLRLPAGSRLIAQVSNADEPSLSLDTQTYPMTEEAPGQYALNLDPGDTTRISVISNGDPLATWPVTIVPDMPPAAAFTEAPSATQRQALRLDYALSDDYGVVEAWAELRLAPNQPQVGWDEILRLSFPLSRTAPAEVRSSLFHDLTPHPWAGRQVLVRLHARDGANQDGSSEAMAITLPERTFEHPVAQEIIAARKKLDSGAAPVKVGRSLAEIASFPGRFDHDTVVYLAISSSFHRLRHDDGHAARTSVRDLLWDTALRLEDGNLPASERDLRAAQQALQEALTRDTPPEELRQLVEELREAMRRFATELAKRNGDRPPQARAADQDRTITDEDLERMLDRIRDLAEMGSPEAAQKLLSQLQQMLENVQQAQPMTPEQRQQAEAMTQMLNRLLEMQRRQQSLIDRTFEQSQQAQPPPVGPPNPNAGRPDLPFRLPNFGLPDFGPHNFTMPGDSQPQDRQRPGPPMPELAQDQDELRRNLGELMHQMGEQLGAIPGALQQAEQAMRGARDSLQQGAGQPALDAETEALEHLRQLGHGMAQQLSNQFGMGTGGLPGGQQTGENGSRPGRRDPLGRSGQASEDGPRIPAESEMQRARRIRDTLYDRSADPNRSVPEQDYLKRLLDQF